MKKNVKRMMGCVLTLVMAISLFCVSAAAAEQSTVEPRYTGIASLYTSLDINSSGRASCYGYVDPYSGYSVDLTVELQRDGETIKTWTDSGDNEFSIDKIYYVTPGHDYQVIVTAEVYNSNNRLVGTPSIESAVKSY